MIQFLHCDGHALRIVIHGPAVLLLPFLYPITWAFDTYRFFKAAWVYGADVRW